jgi:hypothetical protein
MEGTIDKPTLQGTIATVQRRNSSVQGTLTTDISGNGGYRHRVRQAEMKKRTNETGNADASPWAGDDCRKKKSPRMGGSTFRIPNPSKGGTNHTVQGAGQPDGMMLVSIGSVQEFCYSLQKSVATQCHSFLNEIGIQPMPQRAANDEQVPSYPNGSTRHDGSTLYSHGQAYADYCMPPPMIPRPYAAYSHQFVGGLPAYYGGHPSTVGAYPWQYSYPTERAQLPSAPSHFQFAPNAFTTMTMPRPLNNCNGVNRTPTSPFSEGSAEGSGYRRAGGRIA